MAQPLPSSPFSQTEFIPFNEPVSKRAKHSAIKTADGQILINFNDGTSYAMLKMIAKTVGAELIQVSGTWTFTPDPID